MTHRAAPPSALAPLPIDGVLPALASALCESHRALLVAPPGAGKSTRVPPALLYAPGLDLKGNHGKILMLEPRRLAARAVAARIAQEMGEPIGQTVGYRTRLDSRVGRATRIEVLTEGILIRMLQDDPALPGVGAVIFDEFHERSLNADLGLALVLESQEALREDLKLLVMSATLDVQPLVKLMPGVPLIEAPGRQFEVHTLYVPRRAELALELQMAGVIRRALADHDGDVLCFLPGAPEIRRLQRALGPASSGPHLRVLPLYGELDAAAQDLAIAAAKPGERKVVLATSIAETSLTIEGIRVVVDSGLKRRTEFDPASGMSRLLTTKLSQAAANQRRGRAGRLAQGWCYRLWSEGVQASLAPSMPAEILHADLAPLALELANWGSTDASTLRWLDAPPPVPLARAHDLLKLLDAIDDHDRITPHGRAMARSGAHPRLAHMLLGSQTLGALALSACLAASLSERDIFRAEPGRRDADLRLRISALASADTPGNINGLPIGSRIDERALVLARRSSAVFYREFAAHGGPLTVPKPSQHEVDELTGRLLALAYPDRIGKSRGAEGRYQLTNGRGARFAEPQSLAKSPFIVAAELDAGSPTDRDARIFLAAPITRVAIEESFASHLVDEDRIEWDDRVCAVMARRERRLGEWVLQSSDLKNPDPDALLAASLDGLRRLGLASLPFTPELEQWRSRVALVGKMRVAADLPWPDLSDAALLRELGEWAAPWLVGLTRKEHFAHLPLREALQSRLSRTQQVTLGREAPTHLTVPSGSSVPIDYTDANQPSLSVRLQELFGMRETPRIAGGRQALLLKLLSPAGRPVQVTQDLGSFWAKGYHEVKKDLKGRYPKHYWPDDPYTAEPTRRKRPVNPRT